MKNNTDNEALVFCRQCGAKLGQADQCPACGWKRSESSKRKKGILGIFSKFKPEEEPIACIYGPPPDLIIPKTIKLKCKNCNYEWETSLNVDFELPCPNCGLHTKAEN